jgi:hypothetical protein
MLIVKIHQAGSAAPELQQQVWVALQGVRAKYPEAQGIIEGDSLSLSFSFSSTIRPFSGAGGGIYMHLGGSSLGGIAI